jgi:hypothetical protein
MRNLEQQKGAVLFFLVLVLGAASLSIFIVLARANLTGIIDVDEQERAIAVRSDVFGCMDEVLIQLQADSSFSETTVTTDSITCNVDIQTPQAGERDVFIDLTAGNITRSVRIDLTVDPVVVTQVKETF